ncbi:uncharacterized protein CIMG_12425 [Coccidioides immitis RS]|uniref:Uncharacterized protein n=1 Tax=Coccidioides immitis (strain RS) TaxID=246410 RepID=A0A0D8JTF6_COCIM|nr:uncharacterized protein CIMG_12425 [Coccidioides immitis RS]KJF60414.1 hypothetical protein CIMG_12425 [Coccidioides immitis RS]
MAVPSLRLESPLALEYVWTNAACVVGTLVECSPGWPGIPQLPLTGQPQRAVQCRRRDADDGYMPRTPSYTNTKCTGRFQGLLNEGLPQPRLTKLRPSVGERLAARSGTDAEISYSLKKPLKSCAGTWVDGSRRDLRLSMTPDPRVLFLLV